MQTITTKTPHWIEITCETLGSGGVVLHPTSTAYGLAVDATSTKGADKLNRICNRTAKPYIVLVNGIEMARQYGEVNDMAKKLIKKYWPGPLTLVLKKINPAINPVRFDSPFVALRHDNHEVTLALAQAYPVPYTSTSANPSGGPTPYNIKEALDQFKTGDIDLIIDGGDLPRTLTSTIVDCTGEQLVITREGAIPTLDITQLAI